MTVRRGKVAAYNKTDCIKDLHRAISILVLTPIFRFMMALIMLNLESDECELTVYSNTEIFIIVDHLQILKAEFKFRLTLSRCVEGEGHHLVLAGEKCKPKLLAALFTALRTFWSWCAGLIPY